MTAKAHLQQGPRPWYSPLHPVATNANGVKTCCPNPAAVPPAVSLTALLVAVPPLLPAVCRRVGVAGDAANGDRRRRRRRWW